MIFISNLPSQVTPASSLWPQLCCPIPPCGHSLRLFSLPLQLRSSNWMGPVPCPKWADAGADTAPPQPICLHTTWASFMFQESSHTVPHWLLWKTSTLPEQVFSPLTRRMSPSTAGWLAGEIEIIKKRRSCHVPAWHEPHQKQVLMNDLYQGIGHYL